MIVFPGNYHNHEYALNINGCYIVVVKENQFGIDACMWTSCFHRLSNPCPLYTHSFLVSNSKMHSTRPSQSSQSPFVSGSLLPFILSSSYLCNFGLSATAVVDVILTIYVVLTHSLSFFRRHQYLFFFQQQTTFIIDSRRPIDTKESHTIHTRQFRQHTTGPTHTIEAHPRFVFRHVTGYIGQQSRQEEEAFTPSTGLGRSFPLFP
jgi:hypothetical protein